MQGLFLPAGRSAALAGGMCTCTCCFLSPRFLLSHSLVEFFQSSCFYCISTEIVREGCGQKEGVLLHYLLLWSQTVIGGLFPREDLCKQDLEDDGVAPSVLPSCTCS